VAVCGFEHGRGCVEASRVESGYPRAIGELIELGVEEASVGTTGDQLESCGDRIVGF
jgi:hypothetical protein